MRLPFHFSHAIAVLLFSCDCRFTFLMRLPFYFSHAIAVSLFSCDCRFTFLMRLPFHFSHAIAVSLFSCDCRFTFLMPIVRFNRVHPIYSISNSRSKNPNSFIILKKFLKYKSVVIGHLKPERKRICWV